MIAFLFILQVAAVVAAAFCAGVETGFLSLPRARLVSLVRQGSARARHLADALGNMSLTLTTLLIGNNLAAVLFSTVSASLGIRMFGSSPISHSAWTLFTAVFMLLVGEYLPKLMFASRPLRRSLDAAMPYWTMSSVLLPFALLFSAFAQKVFNMRPVRAKRLGVSRDGLRKLVADRQGATRLTQFERILIERVLMLQTRFARDLMHPPARGEEGARFRIPSLTRGDDILPLMRRNRCPVAVVFDETSGNELGVVTEEDVLIALTGTLKEG